MTVQKKILDLTGTQYLVQKITGEIPVKISDLQDDVDMLTSHEDVHLEDLPNESPNIIFENNTPSWTWREMPHGDIIIDWGYSGNPYDKELTFLTSSSKIIYKNNSNSQNTCELAFGQTNVETKTILTMNYYYGSNDTSEPDDDNNYVSSSLVFSLYPGYNDLASSTFDETEYSCSDVSPDCDNYYLGRKNPFKEIRAKDFKIAYGENFDVSLTDALSYIESTLDPHLEDTDIHVTTADKTKWNNGVSQAYVFRYSSTALVASSTNSNTLLDNTDNLKVGDKVIDSSGVLFSITAIDTANNTFTIGTALIDLAQDSDVVHKSGNETISGTKTLDNVNLPFKNSAELGVSGGSTNITFSDKNGQQLCALKAITYSSGTPSFHLTVTQKVDNTIYTTNGISVYQQANSKVIQFRPILSNDNADGLKVELGSSANRYNRIYGLAYYYGNDNVEFSTKFVTTDTNQTIDGVKTYSSDLFVANTDTTANTPNLNLRNYKVDRGTTDTGVQTINFLDKNAKALTVIESRRTSNGSTGTNILTYNTDDSNNTVSGGVAIIKSKTSTNFAPSTDNAVTCGRALAKWSDVVTYKVNGLEPSSLSLPDLSNGVDISSYLNTGSSTNDSYTASVNGYISIIFSSSTACGCYVYNYTDGVFMRSNSITDSTYTNVCGVFVPILRNQTLNISSRTTENIVSAKFFPCQGNV